MAPETISTDPPGGVITLEERLRLTFNEPIQVEMATLYAEREALKGQLANVNDGIKRLERLRRVLSPPVPRRGNGRRRRRGKAAAA